MVEVTDMDIINDFNQGNKNVFADLVKRYQKQVYNTTYRMLGDREDASDLAQEVFLKVYRKLSSFRNDSSFSTWLFSITTNLCRDELRKRKREIVSSSLSETINFSDGEVEREIADEKLSPEKLSYKRELRERIQEVISDLPLKQREVIILRELEGFSYEEIAEILGVVEGTVKSRISRARRKMRKELNKLVRGEELK